MRTPPVLIIIILTAANIGAQDLDAVVEPLFIDSPTGTLVEGRLDWTAGTVTVTGEGVVDEAVTHPVRRRLLGFRAAKVDAYRKLLEVVGGVQVDSQAAKN